MAPPASTEFTAVIKHEGTRWIGWIEEVPGVNCQARTRSTLLENLRITLRCVRGNKGPHERKEEHEDDRAEPEHSEPMSHEAAQNQALHADDLYAALFDSQERAGRRGNLSC